MPSYEKINYLLRPNKSVERKMVCEMLSSISTIEDMTSYQYIGFGSTYFADFSLFHRNLGISRMISIEKEERAQDRCEFNKPFACIELTIGNSSNILPNLNINTRNSIIWLDYDGIISEVVFSDINTIFGMMKPDSFFMLSINAELKMLQKDSEENEEECLLNKMGIQHLSFYRNSSKAYSIKCPILSLREIQALNSHLPCKAMDKNGFFEDEELNNFPVTNRDINQYALLYRYFPNFAETLL